MEETDTGTIGCLGSMLVLCVTPSALSSVFRLLKPIYVALFWCSLPTQARLVNTAWTRRGPLCIYIKYILFTFSDSLELYYTEYYEYWSGPRTQIASRALAERKLLFGTRSGGFLFLSGGLGGVMLCKVMSCHLVVTPWCRSRSRKRFEKEGEQRYLYVA